MIKIRNIKEIANKSACLLLLLFLVSSCSQNNSDPALLKSAEVKTSEEKVKAKAKQGDPEKGKAVYDKYCFYCHGREGRGDGAIAIAVTPHPADFVGDKKKMAKSDEELFESISEGIKRDIGSEEMAMPRWKDILSEEEIWDVLAYVRELSRGKK
ncbi:MAG: hypothetical protein HW415_963 [Deltaproteobacteria bacterium]|nr:hypothetical protein [Deltaproteobacteria bacterium]